MLDNLHTIETPEGIDLVLTPAGPVTRALAYLIDALIRGLILLLISLLLSLLGKFGGGTFAIIFFLLEWFYPVWYEVYRSGMTPGKKRMGLCVVHEDGSPIAWGASLVRNLLRTVDFLPMMYITGVISMLISGNFKRLGDLAAGTLVVYRPNTISGELLPYTGQASLPLPLSAVEQRAVLDFAESQKRLSPQRQAELANLLQNVTHKSDEAAVAELVRYANGLAGRD